MINKYEHAFLVGNSESFNDLNKMHFTKYDFGLFASSWDRRSIEITKVDIRKVGVALLLLFEHKDTYGLRDEHDKILKSKISKFADEIQIVKGRSEDLNFVWSVVFDTFIKTVQIKNRPLNIIIDLSTCPRYYALATIAAGFKNGILKKVTLFYSEGIYTSDKNKKIEDLEPPFTEGKWEVVPIPYLKTVHDPYKHKYYLVSVGFEGVKTMQVVNKKDPDRISILFPIPGIIPEYDKKCLDHNKQLMQTHRLPEEQIIKAPAGDAIEAWRQLSIANLENTEKENIHYLCCGTKPHALALTLRAICSGTPTVLYRKPERHSFVDVKPSGKYWNYNITDLSS